MTSLIWKADCRYFRGDVPCAPHKREGVHCADCPYYDPITERILIIKLGAIGDVIRTTPLIRRLKIDHPHAHLTWLTRSPEVVPQAAVDRVAPFTLESILALRATPFDLVLNLDKDPEACALASQLEARTRRGFVLRDGVPAPVDSAAEPKFLTGIFDDVSRANRKSYVQEIFEIAGSEFGGEEYWLEVPAEPPGGWTFRLRSPRPRVGLNTGCGGRWVSRLWPEENWVRLARELADRECGVVLLGGAAEHEKNRRIATRFGAEYPGHFPLGEFTALVNEMDLVVSAVTMAMHIAIGLKKPLILFNNIFNRHEFELYGRGEILEPSVPCDCYYQPVCPQNCMQYIEVPRVLAACLRHLGATARS